MAHALHCSALLLGWFSLGTAACSLRLAASCHATASRRAVRGKGGCLHYSLTVLLHLDSPEQLVEDDLWGVTNKQIMKNKEWQQQIMNVTIGRRFAISINNSGKLM